MSHIMSHISRKIVRGSEDSNLGSNNRGSNGMGHACVGFGGKGACCAVLPEVSMLLELAMLVAELASCEILAGAVARDARLVASGATCPFACTCVADNPTVPECAVRAPECPGQSRPARSMHVQATAFCREL